MSNLFPRTPRRVAYDAGRAADANAVNPYAASETVLREGWDDGRADRSEITPRLERAVREMRG